jgi:hypothetical protein
MLGCLFLAAEYSQTDILNKRAEKEKNERTPTCRALLGRRLLALHALLERMVLLSLSSALLQNLLVMFSRGRARSKKKRLLTVSNSFNSESGLFAALFERAYLILILIFVHCCVCVRITLTRISWKRA